MRVRTEARREAILETAAQVFLEIGFERASMSEIAARLGGSKATLYGYFSSKEELFFNVVQFKVGSEVNPAFEELRSQIDAEPRTVLIKLGERFVSAILTPEAIALRRLVIAQVAQPGVGERFWRLGPGQACDAMEGYLASATKAGRLNVSDPKVAAQHMLALYESELGWRWILGLQESFSRQHMKQAVARAVDVFLCAYGR